MDNVTRLHESQVVTSGLSSAPFRVDRAAPTGLGRRVCAAIGSARLVGSPGFSAIVAVVAGETTKRSRWAPARGLAQIWFRW